jgi:cation:H+ antiporter
LALQIVLLLVAFGVILGGAFLFTNAVEWLGRRLRLGTGAVGSLIAAVSTALPESAIPLVAIVGDRQRSDEVAIGAIIGAPFMLATVAMALIGLSALTFGSRREQGRTLDAHRPTLKRDLGFFLVLFGAAAAIGLGTPGPVRIAFAILLVAAYGGYAALSLRRGGRVQPEEELAPLKFDPTRGDPPANWAIALQFLVGLAAILGGAHLFVEELLTLAEDLGVAPLVLALLLAPLATELPEKTNSMLWIRAGKDTLALGNVTGAMVFQATLPVAIGVAFTAWELDRYALAAAVTALAGGVVAVWALHLRRKFTAVPIVAWTVLFAACAALVVVGGS